jgi:hypothetical protein
MNYTAIKNRIYRNTKTNASSYPIDAMTDDCNVAMDRVAALIMQADSRWQFDDENETDLPVATTDLVAGQQDYSLATAHLDIRQVAIKDTAGQWHFLKSIDQSDLRDRDLNAASATPKKYDKVANSILLYPAPSYAQAASLRLYFKRGPSYFTTSDSTKAPGFNSLFHDLIALWPSYDFAIANGRSNANQLFAAIQQKEAGLTYAYAHRSPDAVRITTRVESSR